MIESKLPSTQVTKIVFWFNGELSEISKLSVSTEIILRKIYNLNINIHFIIYTKLSNILKCVK